MAGTERSAVGLPLPATRKRDDAEINEIETIDRDVICAFIVHDECTDQKRPKSNKQINRSVSFFVVSFVPSEGSSIINHIIMDQ